MWESNKPPKRYWYPIHRRGRVSEIFTILFTAAIAIATISQVYVYIQQTGIMRNQLEAIINYESSQISLSAPPSKLKIQDNIDQDTHTNTKQIIVKWQNFGSNSATRALIRTGCSFVYIPDTYETKEVWFYGKTKTSQIESAVDIALATGSDAGYEMTTCDMRAKDLTDGIKQKLTRTIFARVLYWDALHPDKPRETQFCYALTNIRLTGEGAIENSPEPCDHGKYNCRDDRCTSVPPLPLPPLQ